jgi:hypothetical protein
MEEALMLQPARRGIRGGALTRRAASEDIELHTPSSPRHPPTPDNPSTWRIARLLLVCCFAICSVELEIDYHVGIKRLQPHVQPRRQGRAGHRR